MRTFVTDLRTARDAITHGQNVAPMWSRHRKMRCAWPTALEDRTPTFDALATAYLAQVQALEAKPTNPRAAYDNVLTACRACHEVSCPGPIEVIEGLRLPAQ
jgi:cytochrome c553